MNRVKAGALAAKLRALELRLTALSETPVEASALVDERVRMAGGAGLHFAGTADEEKREVVSSVLCNVTVQEGRIASYQYKRPFGVLEQDSKGAFCHTWWAM